MINHLKVERVRHNLTQEQLAERVGVSRQSINSIEKNRYIPSTVLALKIAKELSIKVENIFELEECD